MENKGYIAGIVFGLAVVGSNFSIHEYPVAPSNYERVQEINLGLRTPSTTEITLERLAERDSLENLPSFITEKHKHLDAVSTNNKKSHYQLITGALITIGSMFGISRKRYLKNQEIDNAIEKYLKGDNE
ncbi:hypothetical protein HN953_04150 [Candidatus Woesearchaeota archaeon]|jgi:hypothetical protein|nr:hypothetical protein [Candidatus Woesearchaeota archaeon]